MLPQLWLGLAQRHNLSETVFNVFKITSLVFLKSIINLKANCWEGTLCATIALRRLLSCTSSAHSLYTFKFRWNLSPLNPRVVLKRRRWLLDLFRRPQQSWADDDDHRRRHQAASGGPWRRQRYQPKQVSPGPFPRKWIPLFYLSDIIALLMCPAVLRAHVLLLITKYFN